MWQEIQELLEGHWGKVLGLAGGLIFGLLAVKYGLLKAIFVALCAALGYFLGRRLDEQFDVQGFLSKFFREK